MGVIGGAKLLVLPEHPRVLVGFVSFRVLFIISSCKNLMHISVFVKVRPLR